MLKDKHYDEKKKMLRHQHWCKESKDNRKLWNRMHRTAVRNAMSNGNYENVPQYKASGGILTW
ncbi:hypothetical protein [Paenibacillus cymbidii]|uniref:hypothetical protein n=1 Tax=Paenibacillus cymbidii TaxID=1639034 RepID=UPI0010804D2D|nr:hypothetical protein [Paenibacillus cymbidii]